MHDQQGIIDVAREHDAGFRRGEATMALRRGIREEIRVAMFSELSNLDAIHVAHALSYPKYFHGIDGPNGAEICRAASEHLRRLLANPLPGETWAMTARSSFESAIGLSRDAAAALERDR